MAPEGRLPLGPHAASPANGRPPLPPAAKGAWRTPTEVELDPHRNAPLGIADDDVDTDRGSSRPGTFLRQISPKRHHHHHQQHLDAKEEGAQLAAAVAATDTAKPIFHVMPPSGWGSDPNGPIFWKGRYHLFFQARPHTCQWYWGMRWDHVVSYDMARWERLPPAIVPTPGGTDADGCFSGSIQVEPRTGVPVCFYTAARLRTNREVQLPHPPAEKDMGLKHIETQCCAVCDPDDELLETWHKVPAPWLELPHTGQLTAWRDPWFVERGDPATGTEWTMLIGSGAKGAGGTALVYRSPELTKGWRFAGHLCSWPNPGTGICWECPFLVQLQPLPLCAHVLPTSDLVAHGAASGAVVATTAAAVAAVNGTVADGPQREHAADSVAGFAVPISVSASSLDSSSVAATGDGNHGSTTGMSGASRAASGGSFGSTRSVETLSAGDIELVFDMSGGADTQEQEESKGAQDDMEQEASGAGPERLAAGPAPSSDRPPTPAAAPVPVSSSMQQLASGLVDTLLQVVAASTAAAAPAAAADGADAAAAANGNGAATPQATAAGTAAAAVQGSIDVSVTVGPPVDKAANGNAAANGGPAAIPATSAVITVTHTPANAAAVGGADSVSNGTGHEDAAFNLPASTITTAIATVHASGCASAPATATIQLKTAAGTAAAVASPCPTAAGPLAAAPSAPPVHEQAAAAAVARSGASRRNSLTLTSSSITATATMPAAAAVAAAAAAASGSRPSSPDRSLLRDLHAMVHAVVSLAEKRNAAQRQQQANGHSEREQQQQQHRKGGKPPKPLHHTVSRCPLPRPTDLTEQLPAPVTMRYHKAQPLLTCAALGPMGHSTPVNGHSSSNSTTSLLPPLCLPAHADVDSSTTHAHAPKNSLPPSRRWFFCCAPDACTYAVIYWIGEYDSTTAKYDMEGAEAGGRPRKLDMGNVLYATTCFVDPQGRHILWGYMKELRNVPAPPCLCNKFSYSGCTSLPRALYLKGDRLFQLPLPELTALRTDVAFHLGGGGGGAGGAGGGQGGGGGVALLPGAPWRLHGVGGAHLDVELEIRPGTARRTAVLFRSWRPGGRGAGALVYEWATRRLWVVFEAMRGGRRAEWGGEDTAEEAAGATAASLHPHKPPQVQDAKPAVPSRPVTPSTVFTATAAAAVLATAAAMARAPSPGPSAVRSCRTPSFTRSGSINAFGLEFGLDAAQEQQQQHGAEWAPAGGGSADYCGFAGCPMVEASCRPAALAPDTECYTTDDGCALEQQRQQRQQQQLQEQRSDARDGPIAHTPPGDHEAPTTDGPVNELATSCMPGDCGTSRVDTTDREAGQGKGKGTGGPAEWGGEEQEEDEQEEDENTDFDVIRDPDFIPDPDMNPLVEDWIRMKREEAGGVLDVPPGSPLRLRLFVDGSALEVFTDSGQALTTRLYRGLPPAHGPDGQGGEGSPAADPGIELHAVGGHCTLAQLHAYQVAPGWAREGDMPEEVTGLVGL